MLANAKQYQLEGSGDALLSFDKNGVSFDNVTIDGKLVDRKYGHGNSIFNIDGTIHNTNRAESALTQARSQLTAAAGTPVKWEVSTIEGATGLDKLFKPIILKLFI